MVVELGREESQRRLQDLVRPAQLTVLTADGGGATRWLVAAGMLAFASFSVVEAWLLRIA